MKSELRIKEWEREEAEHDYKKAQKDLLERYGYLEEKTRQLNNMIGWKYRYVREALEQSNCQIDDLQQLLHTNLSNWSAQIHHEHRCSLHRLDQEQEELNRSYKQQCQKLQNDIDNIYSKYKE